MSSLKLGSTGGGSVTLTPASTASNLTATVPAIADTLAVQGQLGLRNKIINGAMMIDQRNAGASVNVTGNVYLLDRWNGGGSNDGVLAIQQVADGPTGFKNSLRVTVSTADSSLGSTQYARLGQIIEGFNVADFAGGTAAPATVTLSFWVKSSLTGTFGGNLANGDETQLYVFQYSINSANTWEYKTVTAALTSSGTWATNNTAGMRIWFSLGAGSTYVNTPNTWLTSYAQQASGNINVINTLSATWQITGVQLEKGATATPFENRLYGTELALCQRYFYSMGGNSASEHFASVSQTASTDGRGVLFLPTPMRTVPTVGQSGSFQISSGTSQVTGTFSSGSAMYISIGSFGGLQNLGFDFWPGTSGSYSGSAGSMWILRANNSSATRLTFSAEL